MPAVNLSEQVWGRLATTADDRDTTIEALLMEAVLRVVQPRTRRERVLVLVRAGYTDSRVAEATGELKAYVGTLRRAAGLPANKQRRAGNETAAVA